MATCGAGVSDVRVRSTGRDFRPKFFSSNLPTKSPREENLTLYKENEGSFMNF